MKILLLCPRRSGSTIVWRSIISDRRFVGFDEPFYHKNKLPTVNLKNTNNDLISLYHGSTVKYREAFYGVNWNAEVNLDEYKTARYLEFLFGASRYVCVDETRFCFQLPKIIAKVPEEVFIIWLRRSKKALITSHMLPSRPEITGFWSFGWKLNRVIHSRNFFVRKRNFNDWGYETIHKNLFPESCHLTAIEKLSQLFDYAESQVFQGLRKYKGRWDILEYEDFCANPVDELKNLFGRQGFDWSPTYSVEVRRPRGAHQEFSENWRGIV